MVFARSVYLEDVKSFIRQNLTMICKEYEDWQRTDTLVHGRFREAAHKLNMITSTGRYGTNSYITGRLNIVKSIMFDYLLDDHLNRAGFRGENI